MANGRYYTAPSYGYGIDREKYELKLRVTRLERELASLERKLEEQQKHSFKAFKFNDDTTETSLIEDDSDDCIQRIRALWS